jgi:hypothetical protein
MTMRKGRLVAATALGVAAIGVLGSLGSPSVVASPTSDTAATVVQGSEPVDLNKANAPSGEPSIASVNYNFYAGYLNAGATGRYCFHFGHANRGAVAVSAAARTYNVILTTVSTDLENRLNYGWTYCATIRNSSAAGTDVDVYATAAL